MYYKKLALPVNPVRQDINLTEMNITGGYNLRLPKDVLNDEILSIFSQMNLRPVFVSLFGRNDSTSELDNRMIHTDIKLVGSNKFDAACWKKLLFGINWELEHSYNVFSWWDMSALPECYPAEDIAKKYDILNGIHYVKRGNLGIPEGAIKLQETIIDGPTLVRTDVPHMTLYNNPVGKRVGISVRFDESNFTDWNSVCEFFEPYTR